jgi:HD-like signal output (HDOD) protein
MSASRRILFIDDDAFVLAGLERMLHKDRQRWDLVFARGGRSGLDEARKAPFDVVVSDMRMPEIDGVTVLAAIKDECPTAVRIILSGQFDREVLGRMLPVVHQLLTKPCSGASLRGVLERTWDGADVERDIKVKRLIGGIDKLPSPPDVFFALSRLMSSTSASVADVTQVIQRDPALSAKILQLVNSPYFATSGPTTSIHQAVTSLGTNQLRDLALSESVFSGPDTGTRPLVEEMRDDSLRVAALARALADPADRDTVFTGALLRDLGYIVLAQGRRAEFGVFQQRVARGEDPLAVERDLFGVTHADIGARLLAIWGLPTPIVDVVQHHPDPGGAPEAQRVVASIVHVADALVRQRFATTGLDLSSLERAGCADRVAAWRAIADRGG